MDPSELRKKVVTAFSGVTREGGVSWGQSQLIDAYGWSQAVFGALDAERLPCPNWDGLEDKLGLAAAAYPDCDTSWKDLVSDPSWHPSTETGGFAFIDPIGFRYYLAAAIVRATEDPTQFPPPECLYLDGEPHKFRTYQWSLLTRAQRDCVIDFVLYAEAATAGELDLYRMNPWWESYESCWKLEDRANKAKPIRTEIYEAFGSVDRVGGMAWGTSAVVDNYGERFGNEFHDRESSWRELVDDPEWEPWTGSGGFAFLDPIGFRYYLPAAMVRSLDVATSDQPEFALTPRTDPELRQYTRHQWSALDLTQRNCIRNFVRFQRQYGSGYDAAWSYWETCDEG